jgi:hypothetical protein
MESMQSAYSVEAPAAVINVTVEDVRRDYRVLDQANFTPAPDARLLSLSAFDSRGEGWIEVEHVPAGKMPPLLGRIEVVRDVLAAWRVLRRTTGQSVILCDGSARDGKLVCLLNRLLPMRRRKVVLWASQVASDSAITRRLVRWMTQGCTLTLVWSRRQIRTQAGYLRLPESKFLFLPYKANHSRRAPISMPIGNYIFSGGNSRRDYRTVFDAVRGTEIPLIVSRTRPELTDRFDIPESAIVLSAREPAYARLMAGSRFVVIAVDGGLVRGAAEATLCNAMWHGKAVIAADDLSASEYIEEGVTGYVVAAGDAQALRRRIVELWNDADRCREMGQRAHERVAENFTHEHFMRRLNRLGAVVSHA